jgi:hypothetical protein
MKQSWVQKSTKALKNNNLMKKFTQNASLYIYKSIQNGYLKKIYNLNKRQTEIWTYSFVFRQTPENIFTCTCIIWTLS